MSGDEERPPDKRKHPTKQNTDDEAFFKPYVKPGYTRVFPETDRQAEYTVFVESTKGDRMGNTNPLMLTNLFKNEVKGVVGINRINAMKIGVVFGRAPNANNFLKNTDFLAKHQMKAHIPARAVESIGVLRFVPVSISNEELYNKLSSKFEVVSVRRFTRKVNGELKPFETVSVTFLSTNLPDEVHFLDLYRYRVYPYIAPLMQCLKCFKFEHGAKYCKSVQRCSICAGEHHFKDCIMDPVIMRCVNCEGPHLAISRDCPIKKRKIEEKRNAENYARAVAQPSNDNLMANYSANFPPFRQYKPNTPFSAKPTVSSKPPLKPQVPPKPKTKPIPETATAASASASAPQPLSQEKLIEQIIDSDFVLKGLIGTLVALGNGGQPITAATIRDILIKTLKHG